MRSFYRFRDRRIDQHTLVATRRSKQEADALYRPVGSGPVVERINDYWEIDHTEHTGVLAVDGATGLMIGHPWVSVVLDRCSTMPVGFHLGFDGPSIFATFECLRNAVLPKDYMREAYPQIENDWPCFGLPRTIVPDNGSDFRSSHFMAACLLLATDIQYTPVAKPWYKGRLERFFQTLQTQCRSASSARFADYYRRARRKQPDQVSLITLEELTMLLHKWIADVYAVSPHRRSDGRCPRQVWENSARVHGIVPPPSRERLFSILSLTEFRVPHKYGIEFLGLRYNSARLAKVRIAPNAPKEFRVQIDPGDFGAIRVQDFETGEFFPVEVDTSQRGIAAGVTLHQYKVARALVRNTPDRFSSDADIAKALVYIMEYGRERQGKGTQRERRAIARHTFKPTHREIQQQAGAPGHSLRSVTEEFLDGTDMPVQDAAAAPDATVGDTLVPPPEDDLDLDAEARRLGVRSDTIRDMGDGDEQK
ncbi:Mu transposase C-terminal domain-containing protein [Azospirillum isscasi]|uniref:Mu transposase C-terminal domain-containing protein n=1 Tax=Azospirillum isscasi TaxID=3053926 RepID=A0ABU0WF87_9PROT|nr:Mu transposase C-terminal domain-containing protein [Azospirillum isscasi]MDQ2102882.1 Mu transposase C-terminal domain-containing protein [Azospirillum isscasi]